MNSKLCKLIDNIQNGIENNFYEYNIKDIHNEINNIVKTDNYDILLQTIADKQFYNVLTDLYYVFHKEDIGKPFLARLWYKKLISLSNEKQTDFLNLILSKDVDTFNILAYFEKFMSNTFDLSTQFFVDWFMNLGKYVENDYFAYLFYDGITPFTNNNKSLALQILNKLLDIEYSEIVHNLVSIILGTLRAKIFENITEFDTLLKNSENVNFQKYYYSSLINTFCENGIEVKELNIILEEILDKNNKAIESQAFFIAYRIFLSSQNEEIKNFIIQWLVSNSHQNLTDSSKYYCVKFVQHAIDNTEYLDKTFQILVNIQPINIENLGTYETLSFVLICIMEKCHEKFIALLDAILILNDLSVLSEKDYFINEFVEKIDKTFFTKLFVSKNLNQRSFAQNIYIKNSDKINLDSNMLLTMDDKLFELIFKETLFKIHYGNIFAKFIIDLNNRIDKVKNKLFKNFLDIEISHQCINFPQGCYETLKNHNQACKLIKTCVDKVTNYFDIINKFKDSPVNSFSFASCNDAAVKGSIKQNKEILEKAENASTFKQLCKNVDLLYGDKHAYRTDLGISASEHFAHLEHSVEIPILSFANPISEIFRELEIKNDILRLRKELQNAE